MLVMKACGVFTVDGTNEHMPASISAVHAFLSSVLCNATCLMMHVNTVLSLNLNMPLSEDVVVGGYQQCGDNVVYVRHLRLHDLLNRNHLVCWRQLHNLKPFW